MGKRKKIIAITISLVLHAAILAAIAFHDAFRMYRSVEGFQIGDYGGQATVRIINPADYGYGKKPRQIAAPPRRVEKLDVEKLDPVKRKEKIEKKREQAETAEDKKQTDEASQTPAEQKPAQSDQSEPKFGRLDTNPIKQHVAVLWQAHEAGRLSVPDPFSITAACKVNPDGSFSNIRIVESSGSAELDRTALAILFEISSQRAFAPLSRLASVSVKLEVGAGAASFSLVGFAPNSAVASEMAGQYQTMISAARMFVSNAQTKQLLANTSVRSDMTRVSARVTLPRSIASKMMHDGFSGTE
ncbi:MAG TPA: energy transducer TonB [Blastocatellia bacterium]|nr:energy transducer TonB [Blastocatellia bacterium]